MRNLLALGVLFNVVLSASDSFAQPWVSWWVSYEEPGGSESVSQSIGDKARDFMLKSGWSCTIAAGSKPVPAVLSLSSPDRLSEGSRGVRVHRAM
jgi:hypothetical protein